MFKIVEKNNRHAVHAICYSQESAQRWIERMGNSGLFTDKTLNKESFMIINTNKAQA